MYFVYLDESGDSRFKECAREEADFFVLGGVIIRYIRLISSLQKHWKK